MRETNILQNPYFNSERLSTHLLDINVLYINALERYDSCDVRQWSVSPGSASATKFRSTDNLVHQKFCARVFQQVLLHNFVFNIICLIWSECGQLLTGSTESFVLPLSHLFDFDSNEHVQGWEYAQNKIFFIVLIFFQFSCKFICLCAVFVCLLFLFVWLFCLNLHCFCNPCVLHALCELF